MDYGKVLSRAWEITWRWKALWILGFLAALGRGGGGGNYSYRIDSSDWGDWGYRYYGPIPLEIIATLVGLLCLAVLIGITPLEHLCDELALIVASARTARSHLGKFFAGGHPIAV